MPAQQVAPALLSAHWFRMVISCWPVPIELLWAPSGSGSTRPISVPLTDAERLCDCPCSLREELPERTSDVPFMRELLKPSERHSRAIGPPLPTKRENDGLDTALVFVTSVINVPPLPLKSPFGISPEPASKNTQPNVLSHLLML